MGNRMKFNELGRKKSVEQSWFPCTRILQPSSLYTTKGAFHGSEFPAEGISISGSLVPHCGDQTTDWHVPNEPQQSGSSFLGPQYPTVRIKLQTDGYPANTSRGNLHFWVPGAHCQDQTTDWWVPSQHQQSGSPFLGPQYPTVRIKLQTDGYPANTSRVDLHFWVPSTQLSGSNYRLMGTKPTPVEWISISGSLVPTVRIKLQTDGYPANTSRVDLHFWVPSTQLSGSNYRLMGTQPTPAEWISISGSLVPHYRD